MSKCRVMVASCPSLDKQQDPGLNQEDWVCHLNEDVALVAKRELREEENIRTETLKQFREWIQQNGDLQNCRTDANFLLRFLRSKKFSLSMATQMLLKYLNMRQTFRHLAMELDFLEPRVNQLISSGFMFASPFRDRYGRRVTMTIAEKMDPNIYKNVDMAKVIAILGEVVMMDEDTQVMGCTHIGDASQASMAQCTIWSGPEVATILKWAEQSVPLRHKEVHAINVPTALRYVLEFILGRFSEKINKRIKFHSSVEELHKHVELKVLPKEYGGVMPMKEMIVLWKAELLRKRETLLALDSMKLLSDRSIITRKNRETNTDFKNNGGVSTISSSFRKLEID